MIESTTQDDGASPAAPEAPAGDQTPSRPEWLPEKFKSPEDMAAAYGALEKKLSAPPPHAEPEPEPVPTPAQGLDEDTAKALQQFKQERTDQAVRETLGDPDSVLDWAKDNWDPAMQNLYDKAVESGDAAQIKMAGQALRSAYTEANGSPPNLVSAAPSGAPAGAKPFHSQDDVALAMRDPRYKYDEAYRQEIYARLAVSE